MQSWEGDDASTAPNDASDMDDAGLGAPDAIRFDANQAIVCEDGWISNGVIAEYSMTVNANGDVDDLVGSHTGTLDGPPEETLGVCGTGLKFGNGARVVIADSIDWELSEGSIDFWAFFPALPPLFSEGVVSRDAIRLGLPGHISFGRSNDGRVAVRIQDGDDAVVCSNAAVATEQWVHIGVNFGPPDLEMYVDGVAQSGVGTLPVTQFNSITCNTPMPRGLTGNANPWVIGTASMHSDEGSADPATLPFDSGGVDEFRISIQRRDFTIPSGR